MHFGMFPFRSRKVIYMSGKKIVIAVDGFSSCGKSTLAKALACKLQYIYIDSGAMYRAVTLYALRNGMIENGTPDKKTLIANLDKIKISFRLNPGKGENLTFLNDENIENEIREPLVSDNVSQVSAIGEVRREMVKQQQEMGKNRGIVMDGRDIGTVVFPDAELKIFMTADPEIRAHRRYKEIISKWIDVSFEEVQQNIASRDYLDQNREESPLKKADDAIVLDNSYMTPQQQLDWAVEQANRKMGDD